MTAARERQAPWGERLIRPLFLHRAGIKPPIRVGCSYSCNVARARSKELVGQIRVRLRSFRSGPDALAFSLKARLAHHPRFQKRRIPRFGSSGSQGTDLILGHETL